MLKYAVYEISALYIHTYYYDVIVTLVCLIEHVATTIYIYIYIPFIRLVTFECTTDIPENYRFSCLKE